MDPLLTRLAGTVTAATDLESLARPLLELLESVTGLESTYLTRIEGHTDQQCIVFARNTRQLQIPEGLRVPWGDTLCKRALEECRPYSDDVPGTWGDSAAARDLGIRTYVSQPVRFGTGELYGTLCAASSTRQPITPDALKVVAMFAHILAMQLDRERDLDSLRQANATLTVRALTDPLTGIANRRALVDTLERMLARVARGGDAVQVAFIDLDGFKAINDAQGHDAGDRFLRQVADRLSAATRASELVARYGGDEFVLVAEGAQADELRQRLDAVIKGRYDLSTAVIDYPGASVGVVESLVGEGADALLRRADASMYRIKQRRQSDRG